MVQFEQTTGTSFDFVVALRPDAECFVPLEVERMQLMGIRDVIVPQDEHHGGINDRLASIFTFTLHC